MTKSAAKSRRPTDAGRIAWAGLVVLLLSFLIIPIFIIVPISFGSERFLQFPPRSLTLDWYWEFFSDRDWRAATLFSLEVAVLTMVSAVLIGTLAAVAMVRGFTTGQRAVTVLTLTPIIVPNIVLGVALYLSFAPIGLTGTLSGFVIAHTALAVPFVVLTVSAALHRTDPALELAAINLGANKLTAFVLITLPLITPAVAIGAVFAFLVSFDEAILSFFLSGVSNKTLPRKLFENIDFDISPLIPAVATILMSISLLLMTGAQGLNRRKRAAEKKDAG